jgi:NAD(P)-dependent dehydrogenase (short-subunit alcohol dehydrogenase family)
MDQQHAGYVFITGSSTGIGRACALYLAKKGFSILAGVRRDADAASLCEAAIAAGDGENLQTLQIDVTDSNSIHAAASRVSEIVGGEGLHGLINNAGVGVGGPVEFVTVDQWRKQFEVNVFGQIAVTQVMLPLLRQHVTRHGKGAARIVMIGSIAGRLAQAIMGPYCASKFAVEAISDTLRLELRGQGIGVSLIEPGAIKSEIWRKADETIAQTPPDAPARKDYGVLIDAISHMARKSEAGAPPAVLVAKAVERCLLRERAPTRIIVGRDAKLTAMVKRLLPDRMMDAVLMRVLGIPK